MGDLYILKKSEIEALLKGKQVTFKNIFGTWIKLMKENNIFKADKYYDAEIK